MKSWSQRRVCQERHLESAPGMGLGDGCHNNAVSRRVKTNAHPSCRPNAQEEGGVKPIEKSWSAMHGGRLMECHEDRAKRT